MKKILPFSFVVIASLILAACASARSSAPTVDNFASGGAAPAMPPMPAAPSMEEVAKPASGVADQSITASDSSVPAPSVDRIVIQNAELSIVVSDVQGRMKNIETMAQQMGGYVVSSNLGQNYTRNNVKVPEGQISIRVPAAKLDDALNQIKNDVVEVQGETRSGQDVTAQYVDLKSRLKNLEAAEAQLNDILKTTTNTDDVVSIFNQLVAYREQIEVIKGQIKYYDEAAALSAVNVRVIAAETVQPLVIGKWEPKGVALEAIQDLIDFIKGFIDFMIRFVIYYLPVLVLIFAPFYLAFIGLRALFRKMRGNKTKKELPQEEKK
jgi:hypothetical protein